MSTLIVRCSSSSCARARSMSSLSNHLHPLILPNGSPSHFGREVIGIDLADASGTCSSPHFIQDVRDALYDYGVLVFRGQSHLTPRDEMNFAKIFSHQTEDDQNQQSYTGGAGTQHRLPEYPSVALVGSYRVNNFYGLTAESKGVYYNWHPDQRAWHCDGLADTHPRRI